MVATTAASTSCTRSRGFSRCRLEIDRGRPLGDRVPRIAERVRPLRQRPIEVSCRGCQAPGFPLELASPGWTNVAPELDRAHSTPPRPTPWSGQSDRSPARIALAQLESGERTCAIELDARLSPIAGRAV